MSKLQSSEMRPTRTRFRTGPTERMFSGDNNDSRSSLLGVRTIARHYCDRVSADVLTPTLHCQWDDDGWCVLPNAIPRADLAAAQDALTYLFPTADEMEAGAQDEHNARWRTWDAKWPEFPFHSSRLNALVLHDRVISLAEELLGTSEITLYMGLVTAKYSGQSSGFNQLPTSTIPTTWSWFPARTLAISRSSSSLSHRCDARRRGNPNGVAPKNEGHADRTAHLQLRRLRRPLRQPGPCGRTGGINVVVSSRRLPPLGRCRRARVTGE